MPAVQKEILLQFLLGSPTSSLPNLRSTPVLSLLNRLHWLPVTFRIKYKLAIITYKSLSVAQPTYLHQLLHQYQPTRSLRSGGQKLLALPTISSEFGRRAFSYCAPSVCNNLPLSIRSLDSFHSFKSHLKLICLLIINSHCPLATYRPSAPQIQSFCLTL